MSCGVGRRWSSNPALLWLWYRLAVAAPIRPLAWEPPYAMDEVLKKKKKRKKRKKQFYVAKSNGSLFKPARAGKEIYMAFPSFFSV